MTADAGELCQGASRSTLNDGFSLMELIITMAIVAILAAVAVPSYQDQLRHAKRSDGQGALLQIALAQEKFRANCIQYAGVLDSLRACDADASPPYALGTSTSSPEGHYSLSLSDVTADGFKAIATAIGDQALDDDGGVVCTPLTIDQDGNRGPRACW
jgi:type IV pilus assembly protein PilE